MYDLLKYLVILLVACNSSEMWSGLLVDTENCKFGSLWPLGWFLRGLLIYKEFDHHCLVGGFLLWHLPGTWLSGFGLHLLHTEFSQTFIKWGPPQPWRGPVLLFWLWYCLFEIVLILCLGLWLCKPSMMHNSAFFWAGVMSFWTEVGFYLTYNTVAFDYADCILNALCGIKSLGWCGNKLLDLRE